MPLSINPALEVHNEKRIHEHDPNIFGRVGIKSKSPKSLEEIYRNHISPALPIDAEGINILRDADNALQHKE